MCKINILFDTNVSTYRPVHWMVDQHAWLQVHWEREVHIFWNDWLGQSWWMKTPYRLIKLSGHVLNTYKCTCCSDKQVQRWYAQTVCKLEVNYTLSLKNSGEPETAFTTCRVCKLPIFWKKSAYQKWPKMVEMIQNVNFALLKRRWIDSSKVLIWGLSRYTISWSVPIGNMELQLVTLVSLYRLCGITRCHFMWDMWEWTVVGGRPCLPELQLLPFR